MSVRSDYLGLNQDVYRYDEHGKRTHLENKLELHLKEFAKIWFANLNEKEFSETRRYGPSYRRNHLGA